MSDGRCRACGAALAPNAAWCSLCFADLREPPLAPVAPPAPVSHPPAVPAAASPGVVVPRARGPVLTASPFAPAPPPVSASVPAPEPASAPAPRHGRLAGPGDEPRWPCLSCGVSNPMTEDACGACGAAFLAGAATDDSVRLPVVGDVRRMSTGQRLMLGLVVGLGLMLVLIALAAIGGSFL